MTPTKNDKQRYERPHLRKIDLVAEEVLATGCKVSGMGGPAGILCDATACSVVGTS